MIEAIWEWRELIITLLILWALFDGVILLEQKYGQQARRFFRTYKWK